MVQSEVKLNCNDYKSADMQVLKHHVYEYKKGIRNMVLHTMRSVEKEKVIAFLKSKDVCFWITDISENRINVFFGNSTCVEIIISFQNTPLNKLSPERDFILGIMLGYSRELQYTRYLEQKEASKIREKSFF